jgi:hypothetical protein
VNRLHFLVEVFVQTNHLVGGNWLSDALDFEIAVFLAIYFVFYVDILWVGFVGSILRPWFTLSGKWMGQWD